MVRTALLFLCAGGVVAGFWLRLEEPRRSANEAVAVLALALAPALVRPLYLRVLAGLAAAAIAARIAFDLPLDGTAGTLGSRFGNGVLDFYEYQVPVDPRMRPWMHGVLLTAIFGFCLALGLAVAARRAGLAVAILLLGAGWPATILAGGRTALHGAFILGAALVLLAGLTRRPSARIALPAAGAVLLAGVLASGSAAVSQRQLLGWEQWDFYNRPQNPVSVRYVWNYNYRGLSFPKKVTTVLRIKAPGRSHYWRATTLDEFDGIGWVEALRRSGSTFDPLLPTEARDRSTWTRADVRVEALRDSHLVGASVPVSFETGELLVQRASGGVALIPRGLARGDTYTVWSYSPEPAAGQLVREQPSYPPELARYLEVARGVFAPRFGTPRRRDAMNLLFARSSGDPEVAPYEVLYRRASTLAGSTRSPYGAALAVETWLRRTGGFRYTAKPPLAGASAPLVDFVAQSRAGYCQHFAGAMALMLRYLGIPARVAAGFVSGSYNSDRGEWKITDHDAHAWVEVWFPSYGWLPFDPTPGRGALSAGYTVSSLSFDAGAARQAFGQTAFENRLGQGFFERQSGVFRRGAGDVEGVGTGPGGDGSPIWALVRLLAAVLAVALVLVAAAKLTVRRLRFVTRDPRRLAGACRLELADFLSDQRIDVPRSATLHELGACVRERLGVDAHPFVAAATAARFGPAERAGQAAERAREELRRLQDRIRAQLSRGERLRGLASLRSLGFS